MYLARMHPFAPGLMSLFVGYTKAYGLYKLDGKEASGKVKGKAKTVKGDVTIELWLSHIRGDTGVGIIPINEESQVKFAAIDIDEYPISLETINQRIIDAKLPLITCKTKSGGAHLYCFFSEWVDASIVIGKLREFAAYLGYGQAEIFPRQSKILVERGDIGQWINMPYFGEPTVRYALSDNHQPLSLENFLQVAANKTISKKDIEDFDVPIREFLLQGPPCLQILCQRGFPPGTRNNGLFNLGVYAKKSDPDNWRKLVESYNLRFMDPPLPPIEVLGVIKSLDKKDFNYQCSQQPIQPFCNSPKCKFCKYGVGGTDLGMPRFGTLTKLSTEPPIWFLEIEGGGRLELTTEDLQSQVRFQKICMSALNVMPGLTKRDQWEDIVRRLLSNCTIIEVPKEATARGQLYQLLEDFCTSRVQGKSHDELLLGKPWTCNGETYFRMRDFLAYLERCKFREYAIGEIAVRLKDIGAQKKFFNVKGRGINCYMIPAFKQQTEPLDVPTQAKPPFA